MDLTASVAVPASQTTMRERLNTRWHERSLQVFMLVVLGHWSEHLAQAFQNWGLHWPPERAGGVLGLFYRPVPTSIAQLWVPRVELHLIYNTLVFIPMVIAMYYHMFPPLGEEAHMRCTCAVQPRFAAVA
jgi:hypothetical protein